jgi:hypothetical protein
MQTAFMARGCCIIWDRLWPCSRAKPMLLLGGQRFLRR